MKDAPLKRLRLLPCSLVPFILVVVVMPMSWVPMIEPISMVMPMTRVVMIVP